MAKRKPKVGDRVRFRRGTDVVEGVVCEDRGPLGIGGRHLYGIKFHVGLAEEPVRYTERPAVDLDVVEDPVSTN
jgi:hypothetical protein